MAKKKKEECEEGAPGWMVSYGDMMSLLLTFFVLLLSFSSMQESKFQSAMASIKKALGVLPKSAGIHSKMTLFNDQQQQDQDEMINEVQEMKAKIQELKLEDQIKVTLTEKGAHIIISDPMLFDLGSDQLRMGVVPALDVVADLISGNENTDVLVEGHTDNWPISNPKFPSNWELSAARALSVVKYFAFKKNFDPARFAAVGYGEYRPLKLNTSVENRAANRRVEIYINAKKTYTKLLPEKVGEKN